MKNEKTASIPVNIIYISREKTNNPLNKIIIKFLNDLSKIVLLNNNPIIVSLKYGKRIIINEYNNNFAKIREENLLEIVDYNPIKKIILAIGPGYPCIETSVHWMIHHARKEINAIVQINNIRFVKRADKIPSIKKINEPGTIPQLSEILKGFRKSNKIKIKNSTVIFIGRKLESIENEILAISGDKK